MFDNSANVLARKRAFSAHCFVALQLPVSAKPQEWVDVGTRVDLTENASRLTPSDKNYGRQL